MTDKTIVKKNHKKVFTENPYDVETIFESLSIASDNNMELLYMDRLVNGLRGCEECDITSLSYAILKDLKSI
jgi:hypothetical protein